MSKIPTSVTELIKVTPGTLSSKIKYILFAALILLILSVTGAIYYFGVVRQQPASQKNNNHTSSPVTIISSAYCLTPITDSRDGKIYPTILIGTQCWMGKNLNYSTSGTYTTARTVSTNKSSINKSCYSNVESNCATYGGLYQWAEAVNYFNGATASASWSPVPTGNVQGICPTGWHIPSDSEWEILVTYLGGDAVAGGKLKETGTTHWLSNTGATNTSGFIGLPGGAISAGSFNSIGNMGAFWTATEYDASNAKNRYLNNINAQINSGRYNKTLGFSVRCLFDTKPPLVIGQDYQGGKVAYIFVSGNPGYVPGQVHGLIAAVADQSTGILWYNGSDTTTGATATVLGTGFANSNKIIASQAGTPVTYAAGLARAYTGGGYTDWYLPSKDELHKLYLNKEAIGGFIGNAYWSASEQGASTVWYEAFASGMQGTGYKSSLISVRAVRAF